MSRATPEQVREITGSEATDEEIQPFLDTAHILVNNASACIGGDEELLTQIEAYLAAHLMAVTGQGGVTSGGVSSEKIESLTISYAISQTSGQGTMSTSYGQIANTLSHGCLSAMDGRKAGVCFTGGA